jgi:hypothetical protein
MSYDNLTASRQSLRGTDSNSLLRLHDLAGEVLRTSRSQLERDRAEKALRRIDEELDKRGVPTRPRLSESGASATGRLGPVADAPGSAGGSTQ